MAAKLLVYAAVLMALCHGKHHHDVCKKVPKKKIDTAFLYMETNTVKTNITLMAVTSECHMCDLQQLVDISHKDNSCTILLDTRWRMRLAVQADNSTEYKTQGCSEDVLSEWFLEGGNYTLRISQQNDILTCFKPILINSPMDSNIPIYVALGVGTFVALFWICLKKFLRSHLCYSIMYRFSARSASFIDPVVKKDPSDLRVNTAPKQDSNLRRRKRGKSAELKGLSEGTYTAQDLGTPTNIAEENSRPQQKERLKSLDTFRGISIVIMIFVNYRGGDYWFFRHSKWNGLTVADLVFPWFVWIMGTSMAFSFKTLLRRATPKRRIFWKIFKRSCILFLLGLLINSSDGLSAVRVKEFRIPGVLQRFAGTYLIVATVHMFFAKPNDTNQYTRWSVLRDVLDYWVEWIINLVLVLLWILLTFFLKPDGCPAGYLGPGGLAHDHDGTDVANCTGGAAAFIDREIFGLKHIYHHPTCKEIYHTTVPHDPEGLLGILTSCFMCFLGLQAGKILVVYSDWKARVRRFLVWGLVLGVIAAILCECKKDGGFIPINKNLWSLSFVICLSSFAFFLFSFCYVTIDVYKIWSGAPFYYPGMNAIILYMVHEIFNQPYRHFWGIEPKSHAAYLGINVWDTMFWVLLAYYLHYQKIFISV